MIHLLRGDFLSLNLFVFILFLLTADKAYGKIYSVSEH